ncbi:MAG TPA: hypothetical protein VN667_10040, partial [Burkholderiales bacterium]|nr:hypothetical protein [Burkholderiales bacterium]
HHGLRGMLGSALDPTLMDLYLANDGLRRQVDARKAADPGLSTVRAVEEELADMGADGIERPIMERIVAAMRRILRSIGWKLEVTDADVRSLVARALAAVKNPPKRTALMSGTVLAGEPNKDVAAVVDAAQARNAGNAAFSDYRPVSAVEAERIKAETGLDVSGYVHSVGEAAIRHALKQHGDAAAERARGQEAITAEDLKRLPVALDDPSSYALAPQRGVGMPRVIRTEKAFADGTTVVLEEVRTGRKKLAFSSMWIRRTPAPGAPAARSPAQASETFRGHDEAKPNVADQGDGGNTALSTGVGQRKLLQRESVVNTALRVPMQLLGVDRLTGWAYESLLNKVGGLVPERVKAGVVSDYGISGAVIDRRELMEAHMRKQLRAAGNQLDRLMALTRAESRVAYEWMNNRDADDLLASLPEDSQKALRELKAWIDQMSLEAVRLGQLSADTYEAHKLAYLHRSYRKYSEVEASPKEKASRARTLRVLGEQYKGRGVVDAADMDKIKAAAPEWWGRKLRTGRADADLKGQEFLRFERRQNRGENVANLPGVEGTDQRGKLLEVAYWPAGEAVPARFGDWHLDAAPWQVRGTKGDKLVLWRDFTGEEQDRMGRIDEVRFAVAKTLHQMIHDIEVGKYLQWLAHTQARPADKLPAGAAVVEAKDGLRHAYKPEEWVEVPSGKIPGTAVARYGKLAGLFVPGPVWNDLRQVVGQKYQPLGETYDTLLKAWKVSKTALSPAVHMNNVMANIVMADWHDVLGRDIANALGVMLRPDSAENKKLLEAFEDNGGTQGMYALSELQREQLTPMVEALRKEIDSAGGAGVVNAAGVLQAMLAGKFREAAAAAGDSKAAGAVKTVAGAMIDLYQAEDTVFRLAAFLKAKAEGASDMQAGKFARRSFLDYRINAPWIQMMKQTAFPFISFNYRAVPMMLDTFAHKPWKLAKLALLLGGLNALGYMLSGGDEDRERKLLPEEKQGKVLGVVGPKLVRMPWNDSHDAPVFLDVRRFVPVGDVFDLGQTHSAMPLSPVALPGGPLAVLAELALNRSQFTGKDIVKGTDTAAETAGKVADHLYKAMAPNLPMLPGTYSFQSIYDAGRGRTDLFGREQSTPAAVASAFGVKIGAYPADVARRNIMAEHDAQAREIGENISGLKREMMRKGITRDEFADKVQEQVAKRRELDKQTRERLR